MEGVGLSQSRHGTARERSYFKVRQGVAGWGSVRWGVVGCGKARKSS